MSNKVITRMLSLVLCAGMLVTSMPVNASGGAELTSLSEQTEEADEQMPQATPTPEVTEETESPEGTEPASSPEAEQSPEATPSPEAIVSPEAMQSPETTASPEASQEPEETQDPEATSSPDDETQEETTESDPEEKVPETVPEEEQTGVLKKELLEANPDSDFVWDGSIITKYTGTDVNVVIPENATVIDEEAFKNNSDIKTVAFAGTKVKRINKSAFKNCSLLQIVTLPIGLEEIGDSAFNGCSLLEQINLPEGLEEIGGQAFYNCKKLPEITLPKSLKNMSYQVFYGCESIREIVIPSGINTIGATCFGGCSSLEKITFAEGCTVIPKEACSGASAKEIVIPSTVTRIQSKAFENCSLLEKITLPEGLEELGDTAFYKCKKLPAITLPKKLKSMGYQVFYGCESIREIVFPIGINNIGGACFGGCSNLEKITFEDGRTLIPEDACSGSSAREIVLPSTVKKIGKSAFEGCDLLKNITFPEGLEEIGDSAFEDCELLESVAFPKKLKSIGVSAFWGCNTLKEVEFPAGLTYLGGNSFYSCDALEKLIYAEGTKVVYGCGAQGVRTVVLPSTAEEIADDAFQAYTELRNINLPASLKKIGNRAFGSYGFKSVKNLSELRFEGKGNIEFGYGAFNGSDNIEDVPVYCAYNSKVYKYFINETGFKVISTYTIQYQLNGGQNAEDNPKNYEDNQELTFNAPTRLGYEFEGWYTDQKLTKPFSYDKNSTTGNLVLYAKWKVIDYQLSYDLTGGEPTKGKTNPTTYNVTKDVVLNAPVKAGYVFTGWMINGDKETLINNKISKGSRTGDLALIATWREYTYTVKWNKNGGNARETTMHDTQVRYTEEFMIPEEGYTRDGYDFAGWNTKSNGKGTWYTEGETVSKLSAKDKSTVTLYAQWQQRPFEILYVLKGGVNSAKNPDSYNWNQSVSLQNPTREGYTFAGWYTDAAFTESTKVQKIQNNPGDLTLYAKWTENIYTIKLDGNGGKCADGKAMKPIDASYTEEKALAANEYIRTGYTFTGWNTRKDGKGTAYENSTTVSQLVAKNKGTVTLYAQWRINEVGINYELGDGAVNSPKNPAVVTIAKDVSLSAPTKVGYTFEGWYWDADYTSTNKVKNNRIPKTTTEPVTVYAKWKENQYTLKYDKNSGTFTNSLPTATKYGYSDDVMLPSGGDAVRTNYTLTGWNTKKDRSGTHYDLGEKYSGLAQKGTVTLYAEWTPLKDMTYTITYYNMDGIENRNPDSYSFEKDIKLISPTKEGYTFGGWYTTESFDSKSKVTKISKNEKDNKDLYAKWTENRYTIRYDGNKGSCPKGTTMNPVTTDYTEEVLLKENVFTRKGYEFTGWNTNKNGLGDAYTNSQSVSKLNAKKNGSITLYAQWKAVDYAITYVNMNDADDNSMNPAVYTIEKDVTLKTPEWYGYTFKGWYSDEACKKKITKISRNTADSVTVYAKWEENTYSIRYALQGGTGNVKSLLNRYYTEDLTISSVTPTKEGYTFKGWSLTPSGTELWQPGDKTSFKQLHENGGDARGILKKYVTLYAVWEKE